MSTQVQETGSERLVRLRAEAKELGIVGQMTGDQFEEAIKAKKEGVVETPSAPDPLAVPVPHEGLTVDEAKKIEARLKYESKIQEELRTEIEARKERASIIAESESLSIPIDLPEKPTELELARARRKLGIQKKEVKPSPETVAIEASKRGYYRFANREQDDASHSPNLGGKYLIHLIPDQVHVLSEYHVRRWKHVAVTPVYERVATGLTGDGDMAQRCERTGSKPRFMFEYLGSAPQEAPFGMVTDRKILDELNAKEEQFS